MIRVLTGIVLGFVFSGCTSNMASLSHSNEAIPGEESPFGTPQMKKRPDLFLSSYGTSEGRAAFGFSELIAAAIGRLHAIAAWTEEFVRSQGNVALADHPAMYRGHARWLGSWNPPVG